MSDPRGDHDKAALSVYLSDLHNLIRGPSPTLANAIRVLSEPLHFLGLVSPPPPQHNATATSTTARYPIWNGPVQPTRELRRYFVQQLLPSHLDFILDSITVDWLSALPSSAAQAALFDVYFVPRITAAVGSHSIHDKDLLPKDDGCSDQCMGITVVALQTLVGRLTRKAFEQNHSFLNQTILRLLRKHLEHYTLLDYHVYIATYWSTGPDRHGESGSKMHGKLKEAGQATTKELALEVEDTFWDSFLSKLFSVPTRVSNAMGSRFEAGRGPSLEQDVACFHEKVFLERLAGQLKTCFEVMAMTKTDREKVLRVKHMELCQEVDGHQHRALTFLQQEGRAVQAFGGVLDKFLKLGYSIKELMLTMWSLPDSVTSAGCRRALTLQSASRSARLFLFALVDHLQQHHVEFKQGSQPQTQEQEKQQLLAIHQGAKLLVALGYGVGGENNEWMEQILFQGKVYSLCILRMLLCVQSAWPDPVQATKDISYQILLMLGYFDSRILSSMDLIPVFGAGMNNWLDLENTRRKTISLVVAEEFTKAMAAGETSADFELDPSDPEICLARSLVELKDGTRPYQPLEIPSKDGADNEEQLFEVSHAEIEDEDEDEDPDEIIGGFTRARIDSGDETEDTDSDEDSDEDLKPYSMEYESDPDEEIGAVKKPMVPQPLYLRDLNTYLKANEDRDKFEIGLGKAADLIRRKAASLELG
ncbi:hypothetical protein BGW38_001459 [Lunasporangiospora selenospora]|uniref:Telomere length regulation protein conserved domain-containing protein n=1 Tax=Lunasporangiospora selenospora TaxID=979761 RepID=A0A9P6KDI5_9FUNG|nr:hypothetical protein BGW38_001459 [Lunasporangiospora selenospora]